MKKLIFCMLVLQFSCTYSEEDGKKTTEPVQLGRTIFILDTIEFEPNKKYLSQYSDEFRKQLVEVKENYPLVAQYTSLLRLAHVQGLVAERVPLDVNLNCLLYALTGNDHFLQFCVIRNRLPRDCGRPEDYFRPDKVFMGQTVAEGVSMDDAMDKWSACWRGDDDTQPVD